MKLNRLGAYLLIFVGLTVLNNCKSTVETEPNMFVPFKGVEHEIDFGDDYVINESEASLSADTLLFEISNSGGCKEHEYEVRLNRVENFTAYIFVNHDANGDACEAYLTHNLKSDLSDLLVRDDFNGLNLVLPDSSELILR